MTLVRNILAIFGMVTLALNAVGELDDYITLSHKVAEIVDGWSDFVTNIWAGICMQLGLPVIEVLAKPFSFAVATLTLVVSASITLGKRRDEFLSFVVDAIESEASKEAPDESRLAVKLAFHFDEKTSLTLFRPEGDHLTELDVANRNAIIWNFVQLGAFFSILMLYAASNVSDRAEGIVWVFDFLFLQLLVLFLLPFLGLVNLADFFGRLSWGVQKSRRLHEQLYLLKHDYRDFTTDLGRYQLGHEVDENNKVVDGVPFFDGIEKKMPNNFFGRAVGMLTIERALGSIIVVFCIYVLSSVMIILETAGVL